MHGYKHFTLNIGMITAGYTGARFETALLIWHWWGCIYSPGSCSGPLTSKRTLRCWSMYREKLRSWGRVWSTSCEEQLGELRLLHLRKRRLRGDLINLCNCLEGGCRQVCVGLFCCVSSERTSGNSPQLWQGRPRLDFRKKSFHWKCGKHQNKLPREVVELPSLEEFKSCLDVAPEHMIYVWLWWWSVDGLNRMFLNISSNLDYSVMSYSPPSFNLYLYWKVMFSFTEWKLYHVLWKWIGRVCVSKYFKRVKKSRDCCH